MRREDRVADKKNPNMQRIVVTLKGTKPLVMFAFSMKDLRGGCIR
jgi:hypothetical protein